MGATWAAQDDQPRIGARVSTGPQRDRWRAGRLDEADSVTAKGRCAGLLITDRCLAQPRWPAMSACLACRVAGARGVSDG